MAPVQNTHTSMLSVGNVNLKPGEIAEVDSDTLEQMGKEDAGKAANAAFALLKKPLVREDEKQPDKPNDKKAVKDLKDQIKSLKSEVADLKTENDGLKSEVAELTKPDA